MILGVSMFLGLSAAAAEKETEKIDGFAQCEDYVNVREQGSKKGEIIGKLYKYGAVEILDEEKKGWYHIHSGNVEGYVSSDFIATGKEAEEIAKIAGYTTAEVGADILNVRQGANMDSEVVATAFREDELEVVDDLGDWVKVVLEGDIYGYVSRDYVKVSTEYPKAYTLEEDQARLDEIWIAYLKEQGEFEKAAEAEVQAAENKKNAANKAESDAKIAADAAYEKAETAQEAAREAAVVASAALEAADTAYQSYEEAAASSGSENQQNAESTQSTSEADAAYQEYLAAEEAARQAAAAQEEAQKLSDELTQAAADAQVEANEAAEAAQEAADEAQAAYEEPADEELPADEEMTEDDQAADEEITYDDEEPWEETADDAEESWEETTDDAEEAPEETADDGEAAGEEDEAGYYDDESGSDTYEDAGEAQEYEEGDVDTYDDGADTYDESTDTYDESADTYDESADASYDEYTDTYDETAYNDSGNTYSEESYQESYEGSEASYNAPAPSSTGQAIADYACQFIGNPYVWGGNSLTDGADCSGFVMAVFQDFGISLPHNAASQSGYGSAVSTSELAPGDLVFYDDGGGISHVAIYVGNGSIVHASNSASGVCYSNVFYSTPACCRRIA